MKTTVNFSAGLIVIIFSTVLSATEIFSDDFEDGAWEDSWTLVDSGTHEAEVTGQYAAAGQYSIHLWGGDGQHFQGLHAEYEAVQLDYIYFYTRMDASRARASNYFVIGDSDIESNFGLIFFRAEQDEGNFVVYAGNGISFTHPVENQIWYHIEFQDIDWDARTWDWYVDSELVQADIPFRAPYSTVASRIHLYNWCDDGIISHAWFDEIYLYEGEENVTPIALDHQLLTNYPNPFNPTTTINYYLPVPGLVTLRVYDISGQLTATVVDGHRSAGEYSVTFDGSGLPSGIYFYELTAGGGTQVERMLLLK